MNPVAASNTSRFSATQPFVTVIVPTYNDWEDMARCAYALSQQSYAADRFEVIIANNNPANQMPADLQLASNARVILVEAPGSYAARNAALAVAEGEVIAFTDSDCTPEPDWVERGVAALTTGIERAAGKVSLYFRSDKLTAAEVYEKAFAFRQERSVAEGASVTANLFVWRKVFERVGVFDSNLMSGGDMAWNRHATSQGVTLSYADDAVVHHPARHTIAELKKKKKRVSGGVATMRGASLKELLKGLMPPLFTLKYLNQRKDLPIKQKLVAFGVLYYLKVYGAVSLFKVAFNIEQRARS